MTLDLMKAPGRMVVRASSSDAFYRRARTRLEAAHRKRRAALLVGWAYDQRLRSIALLITMLDAAREYAADRARDQQ